MFLKSTLKQLALLACLACTLPVLAGPGDGQIHWSTTDKNADVILSTDLLGIEITGTDFHGVRSNHALSPGDGFYYFEMTNVQLTGQSGFGIATASASLDTNGGLDTQSLIIDTAIQYNSMQPYVLSSKPTTVGIAVDYRGDYPIVHFMTDTDDDTVAEFLTTISLTEIHEPVFIYSVARDAGAGEQQRLNLGATAFAYDPVATLELSLFNGGAGLQTGWPLPDAAPVVTASESARVILSGESTQLTATAIDAVDGDLSAQIEWFLDGLASGSGGSIDLAPAVGSYVLEAYAEDQWEQVGIDSIALTVIAADTEDTDGDGLSYAEELLVMTDPAYADTDNDGLSDFDEINTYLTNPLLLDHDGDTLPDGYEVAQGFDPLVADGALDADSDTFTNAEEFAADTDPQSSADYPGFQQVVFNGADADGTAVIDAGGLRVGFSSAAIGGVRSDVAAAPGSGWHYFEGSRLVDTGSIGLGVATASQSLQVAGGSSDQSVVINTQGQVLYNNAIVTTLANPERVATYGFALDYSGSEPVVYILYKESYGGDFQSLAPITLTGVTTDLYIFAYGDNQGQTYSHQLNAGAEPDTQPFAYPADYVLFQTGISSAEFMATGWGSDHAYISRATVPTLDRVFMVKDDNTDRLITLSDNALSVGYKGAEKNAIIANQGMIGEFRYWEGSRDIDPQNIGFGLISAHAYKSPYCCSSENLDGAPPSMSVNALGSGWRNLVFQFGVDISNDHYGFAVDYRGPRPIVYVIANTGVVGSLLLDDFITPIHPMMYGGYSDSIRQASANFGETPFYYNARLALQEFGVDLTGFVPGWGIHQQENNLGNGTNQAPEISIPAMITVELPNTALLSVTATDYEDGDLSAAVTWTDAFDGQSWTGAEPERTLAYGSHAITLAVTDSDGNETTTIITVDVEQPVGPDSDGDGLVDALETYYGTGINNPDSDDDGLNDFVEILWYDSNPLLADTDGDLISDFDEILYGLDPLVDNANDDSDLDTFTNAEEISAGTDPLSALSYPGGPVFELMRVDSIGNNTGSGSWLNDIYTVSATGSDIEVALTDNYQYMYTRLNTDAELIVRVDQFTNAAQFTSKAGIMLRTGLAQTSESAYVGVTSGVGTYWVTRSPNGAADSVEDYAYNGIPAPLWLRMVRDGNTATGYYSSDGVNWTESGSIELDLSQPIYIGLAVAGNFEGAEVSAEFSNLTLNVPATPGSRLIDNGDTTTDTETGLEWLDLTLTQGVSAQDILADYGGYITAGWTFATLEQVCGLLGALGDDTTNCTTGAVGVPMDTANAESLVNLLGNTVASGRGAYGMFNNINGFPDNFGLACINDTATSCTGGGTSSWLTLNAWATGYQTVGSFLVRSTTSPPRLVDNGDTTTDTETDLEWLDLTLTQGVSAQDILAGYGGYIGAGWTFATLEQVCELLGALGDDTTNCTTGAVGVPMDAANAETLVNLLGNTVASGRGAYGMFNNIDGFPDNFGLACINDTASSCTGGGGSSWLTLNAWATGYQTVGSFLVRSTTSTPRFIDNGDTTTDTETGLEWLDLTLTQGIPAQDILADYGGYISAGWTFATPEQVCGLLGALGDDTTNCTTGAVGVPMNAANAETLVNLLGNTVASGRGAYGMFNNIDGFPDNFGLACINDTATSCTGGGSSSWLTLIGWATGYQTVGSFLVRPSQ